MDNAEKTQGHGRPSNGLNGHVATHSFRVRTVDEATDTSAVNFPGTPNGHP
jgi:hypothetical protein